MSPSRPARPPPRKARLARYDAGIAEFFLGLALNEARKVEDEGTGEPGGGAVLVRGGRIVGRGHQARGRTPHAEMLALDAAGEAARGADLYCTLEPCDPADDTLSCSAALMDAGVRRVVCGAREASEDGLGRGLERLRRAGVKVQTGVLRAQTEALHRVALHAPRTGRPFVTLKAAVSLDGKLATQTGDSSWVSGEASRAWVHRLRHRVDAILVGANTLRADDPRLTTRLPEGGGRDPLRVLLSSDLRLPSSLEVFQPTSSARTVVATTVGAPARRARTLEARGVEVWRFPESADGRVQLPPLLRRLTKEGMAHLLVEGGAEVFAAFLKARCADELVLFLAPKVVGAEGKSWMGELGLRTMAKALRTGPLEVEKMGEDVMLRAQLLPTERAR